MLPDSSRQLSRLANETVPATDAQLKAGLTEVNARLVPATPTEIVVLLKALGLHYYRPNYSAAEFKHLYTPYIELLRAFPVDVLKSAITDWHSKASSKWFPNVGALKELADPHYRRLTITKAEIERRCRPPEPDNRPDEATRKTGADWARNHAQTMGMSDPHALPTSGKTGDGE